MDDVFLANKNSDAEDKPGYYAVLPAEVRYDPELGSTEKLLFAEITALCNKEGYCWASNAYMAKLFSVSVVHISRMISRIEDRGYIHVEIDHEHGNRRKIFDVSQGNKEKLKELFGKTAFSLGVNR